MEREYVRKGGACTEPKNTSHERCTAFLRTSRARTVRLCLDFIQGSTLPVLLCQQI